MSYPASTARISSVLKTKHRQAEARTGGLMTTSNLERGYDHVFTGAIGMVRTVGPLGCPWEPWPV